jgi:ectoine hydroxylase-related dioxygenase (phytanoyl-CoA dioxygenase family)
LHPQISEIIKLILGPDAIAIQSLFFEYGSEQMLHRDPVLVPTGGAGHLAAAWIALEDIHPDSGALVYYPKSHKLPYYEFAPGQHMFESSSMGQSEIKAGFAFDEMQCEKYRLTPNKLCARKGDVFIWHASLRHGGAKVKRADLTRKSFVVHYSKRSSYLKRAITISPDLGNGQAVVMETDSILTKSGASGFDNPMRGKMRR